MLVSHADIDHFNAIPNLVRRFPVETLYVPGQMRTQESSTMAVLLESLTAADVPIRDVQRGDQWMLADGLMCRVLHPVKGRPYASDNAASMVVEVTYANRRFLLTGDVEQDGLEELLATPSPGYDVVLAPHHGSHNSQPRAFLDWANAETIVISGGRLRDAYDGLRHASHPRTLRTARNGAVQVTIDREGRLHIRPFRRSEAVRSHGANGKIE